MTGNELLWPAGRRTGALDFRDAAEDLELDRLGALLFPGLRGEEALEFAQTLATGDPETLAQRQRVIRDLTENPALLTALDALLPLMEELRRCDEGVRGNAAGLSVTRLDAAMDGVKKAVLRLERNLSKQGADMLEENAADNRYAQLLRAVLFRRTLTETYVRAMTLLRDALDAAGLHSPELCALRDWVSAQYAADRVDAAAAKLQALEREWAGVSAFAVDVCLDGHMGVVGLEIAETRAEPYARGGMLDFGGDGEREGITALLALPQNGSTVLFQEYLLSELGYELRGKLTRLRGELLPLKLGGGETLLDLRDALRFYRAAAGFALRLEATGLPVCLPEVISGGALVLDFEAAYPPELALTGQTPPVSNDLRLGPGSVTLLTGPNSSGKTFHLLLAGQLVFLAQLGCPVPAARARFSPRDRLLTLFAAGESETGEDSRMGMEVERIREISGRMTADSLVLLNEPMTSTSAQEGARICADLLLDLARKGVPGMLVTHFSEVYPLLRASLAEAGLSDRLRSLVMTVRSREGGLDYLYKLVEAPPPPSSHARAVVAKKGVTLDAMLARMTALGVDVRPDAPGWAQLRRGLLAPAAGGDC